MIKMIIGGEEVVSNKEFTINEEMLSASSTILNNCYPKSWEDNKDYTSNFYYPKDYSRFVLGQGEYLYGNDEFAVLKAQGRNLFDKDVVTINYYYNGSGEYVEVGNTYLSEFIEVNENTVYTLKATSSENVARRINYFNKGKGWLSQDVSTNNQTTITTPSNTKYVRISFNILVDIDTIQFEKGSTSTSYENYIQPMVEYETNVKKEINNFNIYGNKEQGSTTGKSLLNPSRIETTTKYGITCSYDPLQQIITFNGTCTADNTTFSFLGSKQDVASVTQGITTMTAYYVSGSITTYLYWRVNNSDWSKMNSVNLLDIATAKKISMTANSTFELANSSFSIRFNNGSVANNLKIKIMVAETTNTDEEPYTGQIPSPCPYYEQPIKNVGYRNLFNINGTRVDNQCESVVSGNVLTQENLGGYARTHWLLTGFTPGKRYVLTLSYENIENSNIQVRQYDSTNTNVINNGSTISYSNGLYKSMFIATEKSHYFRFYSNTSSSTNTKKVVFKNILVEESDFLPHSYIPYGKYGIELSVMGKNMIDPSKLSFSTPNPVVEINEDTITIRNRASTTSTNIFLQTMIPDELLKNGEKYTLSYENISLVNELNLQLRNKDGSNANKSLLKTVTYDENYSLFIVSNPFGPGSTQVPAGAEISFKNLQLENGSSKTEYIRYAGKTNVFELDEPLRETGNVKDKLHLINNVLEVERNVGEIIYNGSESWTFGQQVDDTYLARRTFNVGLENNSIRYITNLFTTNTAGWNTNVIGSYFFNNEIRFRVPSSVATTTQEFKNWLVDNNIILQYPLSQTSIMPIGYVDLPYSNEEKNYGYVYGGINARLELYYYWKNYDVLFAGVVKNTGDISLNPRYPHYCNLQILDYKTFLSESNTLDFVIANKTVKEAIGMVVNAISGYGFILGEINIDSADDIIGAYSTLNKTAYDVLQYLANISGSRWRARYVDSSTMAIDFYDPDTLPQGANIEYTQEYWENNNIVDLTFNYGTRDYRNKQILLSDEVYANINYNETLISNGYTNTFTLQNNIGTVVNILVGNEEKTVATTNDKQMGIDADFYYAPGKNIIESNSVYSAGTLIKITYQPLVKGRQIVYNTNEVDRISTETDTEGVIARYENRNDILSSDELEKIAQTYIEYKGKAEVILTLTTRNNDLYNIGEVVYFDAPIPDLAQNYMVKTKKTEYIVIDEIVNLFYIYEMTSSFNSEKAINYFDNQRNKASGNIAEGDSITRNIDIETDVAIIWTAGTVSSASITVDGDNVLNSVLNSPFVE